MPETPLTPAEIQARELAASKEGYGTRVAVAFDQFLNVVFRGKPGETISARTGRAAARGNWFGKAFVWILDRFQRDHGEKAMAGDLQRAKAVEKTEEQGLFWGAQLK